MTRVFYAHPVKLYGTPAEARELAFIGSRFSGWEIVNPSAYQRDAKTEYYLELVASCDSLVFSRHYGYLTEGVKPEVDFALSTGKPVFELRDGRFTQVSGPVENLSFLERVALRVKGAFGLER